VIRALASLVLTAGPVWPAPPNPMQLTRKAGLTPETHMPDGTVGYGACAKP
jgi:hypothetical protein